MKKRWIAVITAASVAVAGGGGYGIYHLVSTSGAPVEVVDVAGLNMGWWGQTTSTSGTISSTVTQQVHVTQNQLVQEIYVKEGDEVKIGDPLMAYDMTLAELDLEMEQLNGKAIDLQIAAAQKDLEKLKKETPISASAKAGMMLNDNVLLASNDAGTEPPVPDPVSVVPTEAPTEAPTELPTEAPTEAPTEPPTESSPETQPPETTAGNGSEQTEKSTDKNQNGSGTPGSETGSSTETGQSTEGMTESSTGESGSESETGATEVVPPETEIPTAMDITVTMNQQVDPSLRPEKVKIVLTDTVLNISQGPFELTKENNWTYKFLAVPIGGTYSLTSDPGDAYDVQAVYDQETKTYDLICTPKAYEKLDEKSEPYKKGEGKKDSPDVYFCKEGAKINASFLNKVYGYDIDGKTRLTENTGRYVVLEMRKDDEAGGEFVNAFAIDGTQPRDTGFEPDSEWTISSSKLEQTGGMNNDEPDIDIPDIDFGGDWGFDGFPDGGGYTADQLKQAINEKEAEIKKLQLDKRESDLKIASQQRKLDNGVVKSSINGIVKTVGDPNLGEVDNQPFMTVVSAEGLYVTGFVSELELERIQVGSVMTGFSYESGTSFMATITEISQYPTTNGYYSGGNSNASYYPFTAYIDEGSTEGLSNYQYVDLQIQENVDAASASALYIEKAYIRTENGQSYVYKADENNRLKKQYIKTGKTVYSTAIEVKEGLSIEDKIAFPYGKNVKEGAKVKTPEEDDNTVVPM